MGEENFGRDNGNGISCFSWAFVCCSAHLRWAAEKGNVWPLDERPGLKACSVCCACRRAKEAAEKGLKKEKRISAAKAALQTTTFGTAEAVPLSKTNFFSSL
jgi:hypothetical protein